VLDRLGGPLIFLLGGIAVVASALALQRVLARTADLEEALPALPGVPGPSERVARPGAKLLTAFILGGGSAFITRLASEIVPGALTVSLGSGDAAMSAWATATLGASSMLAPSIAPLTIAAGKGAALVFSVIVAALCALAAPLCGSLVSAAPLAMALGAALAIYLDCALPYAFELVPDGLGLSAGLYLGGVFAGSQLATLAG
jgi:hypothetical protein